MNGVNMASIMQKIEAYSHSREGRQRIKECVERYAAEGIKVTAAGSRVITETDMWEAASKMIGVLRSTAQSYDLPESVMRHFNSLDCSSIYRMPDGSSVIYVYFEDDLHRNSLCPEDYNGVDNIIALLNNGYHAKNYVYGSWDGHHSVGESVLDGRSIGSSAYIRSRKDREGLHFIQQAIQDFNGNYGTDFSVTAVAGDDYK